MIVNYVETVKRAKCVRHKQVTGSFLMEFCEMKMVRAIQGEYKALLSLVLLLLELKDAWT